MKSFREIVLGTGILGAVAFVIATYFPANSPVNRLAIIWPFIAGAVALSVVTRLPAEHRLLNGLRAALLAGVVLGVGVFVGISIVASLRVHFMHLTWDATGQAGLITAASMLAFATIGAVAFAFTLIGGVLTLPVRFVQLRRSHAVART